MYLFYFCYLFSLWVVISNAAVCNVLDYGAKGDGKTDDTKAIQQAIDSCSIEPLQLDTVMFPSNYNFLSFPIKIKTSNTQFYIANNATLTAYPDYEKWPVDHNVYVSFITNNYGTDYTVFEGGGIINGNGEIWWKAYYDKKLSYQRPRLIDIAYMNHLGIYNLTLIDSPFWHINFFLCVEVNIHHVNVLTNPNSPNTDGIDVGGQNVHIYDTYIMNGDDSLVLKQGGYNVLIENSTIKYGYGLDIGTGGNITHVTFRNIYVDGCRWALRLKAKGNTQFNNQSDITYKNITLHNVSWAIDINEFNQSVDNDNNLQWVDISNVVFEDIRGEYNKYAGHLNCNQDYPCRNLTFNNIVLKPVNGANETWQCSDNVYGTQHNVTPPIDCLHS